ncbi:NAD(P)/FAD-dependent oxidoreductase [Sporolactobacillus sp. KGMB 08714]|uniref:NAD(P)/FAD-dependent oxidoreductase n=1 Tax=Sporolactobacillus sp. KGMB 08714 TaxID=3064704 RepID=UPI002FBDE581
MTKRIIVLGGGAGGTMAANRLARQLGDEIKAKKAEVVLISNTDQHIYQPGFMYIALGEKEPEHFIRRENSIVHRNVVLITDRIEKIDVKKKVLKSRQNHYPYDYLVISTGSRPDFNSLPGLAEGASNFYTLDGAIKLRDQLANIEKGRILITVDVPHKCPVAPLELVLMLDEYFRKRGIRDKIELKYTYPINRLHSLEPVSRWAEPEFEKRHILSETFFNLEKVDPKEKVAITMDGEEHPYDILISVPAHTGAQVIIDSGLGDEDGFIPTDRHTLKMENSDCVYVIGDATNLPISKAGSTAHYETETVVPNLMNRIKGRPETAVYDGKVACFLENSLHDASMIAFDYKNPPKPAAASEFIHWFKAVYNELYWLNARGIL